MNPTIKLAAAIRDRDTHAEECAAWDYEGSDCAECHDHARNVKAARKAVASRLTTT